MLRRLIRNVPVLGSFGASSVCGGRVTCVCWVQGGVTLSAARLASGTGMKGVKKENLPSKECAVCHRPFTWRKKWERCWDEVMTCSKRCKSERKKARSGGAGERAPGEGVSGVSPSDSEEATKHADSSSDSGEDSDCPRIAPRKARRGKKAQPQKSAGAEREHDEFTVSSKGSKRERKKARGGGAGERSLEEGVIDLSLSDSEEVTKHADASSQSGEDSDSPRVARRKARRERKAQAQKKASSTDGSKECGKCGKSVNLLVRCQIDSSAVWNMVCGSCWNTVSGGVADGDDEHPHYRYGGLWKNRRAV